MPFCTFLFADKNSENYEKEKKFKGIQRHWQRKQQKTYNLIQSNEHTVVRMINDNIFPFRAVSVPNLGFIPHYLHFIYNICIHYSVRSLRHRFRNNSKIIDFVFIHFIESFRAENFQVLLSWANKLWFFMPCQFH